jgi:uncharacterized hydantoinase/oxoprolinase family protein
MTEKFLLVHCGSTTHILPINSRNSADMRAAMDRKKTKRLQKKEKTTASS